MTAASSEPRAGIQALARPLMAGLICALLTIAMVATLTRDHAARRPVNQRAATLRLDTALSRTAGFAFRDPTAAADKYAATDTASVAAVPGVIARLTRLAVKGDQVAAVVHLFAIDREASKPDFENRFAGAALGVNGRPIELGTVRGTAVEAEGNSAIAFVKTDVAVVVKTSDYRVATAVASALADALQRT